MIKRTIQFKSNDIMLNLYTALVRPLLEYCTAAWSPHYIEDKEKLEKIQHRFSKLIPELKDLPHEDRIERLCLWTLEERRNRADLIEVYKMHRGLSKVSFKTCFEPNENSRTRGHSPKLKKKRCNTVRRQHFFSERVVNGWNMLEQYCFGDVFIFVQKQTY